MHCYCTNFHVANTLSCLKHTILFNLVFGACIQAHVFKFYLKTRATAFVTTYERFELFTLEGESSLHLKSCDQ